MSFSDKDQRPPHAQIPVKLKEGTLYIGGSSIAPIMLNNLATPYKILYCIFIEVSPNYYVFMCFSSVFEPFQWLFYHDMLSVFVHFVPFDIRQNHKTPVDCFSL